MQLQLSRRGQLLFLVLWKFQSRSVCHALWCGLVGDDVDTSGDVDIRDVSGNVIVFEADRKTVEDFHRNDPYTLEDMFEFAIVERIWQRVPDPSS